ncbi:hypothetical protein JCM10213_001660 [Rhodosporidiobolus nylandii]
MSTVYTQKLLEHATLPPISPLLPPTTLSSAAALSLTVAFVLSFYFSTLRAKSTLPVSELAVAALASVFGGFGLVFAFCSVGLSV